MSTNRIIAKTDKYLMHTYGRFPIAIEKGKGSWVWDAEGNKYLDFTSGIAVTNLGHSHPDIKKAISEQSKKILHTSNLFYNDTQAEFAKLLVNRSFADKVFFCNSGTEANEGAIKLARKWGEANGGKYKIVHASDSFHGRTMGSLSATNKKYQSGFKPLVPGFKAVRYGHIDSLKKALDDKKVCAVILEPIQGENGVIIPPPDYIAKAKKLCTAKKVLLILDEIQVGFGRTGKLFAYQHSSIEPDIMTLAKALGGGIPCGAFLAKDKIAKYLEPGNHGTTLGGNPLAMSVGLASLSRIIKDRLPTKAAKNGKYFLSNLKELQSTYTELIKDARGMGLILGLEFKDHETAKKIVTKSVENGLLTILTEQTVMRMLPPLNVSQNEIDAAIKKITQALEGV